MATALRTSLIWHDEVMGDVVSERAETITIGPHDGSTFITPELGLPRDFAIVRPGRAGHILSLAEHMRGTICVGGVEHDVATLVRGSETPGFFATALGGLDWGVVELDPAGHYKLFFQLGQPDSDELAPRPLPLAAAGIGFGVAALVLAVISALQGAGAAESLARGTGIAALALGLATGVRWLVRQDFESRASLAFSTLLHAFLLFATFAVYEHEAPFVWPGQRRITADYIATRLHERFAPPAAAVVKPSTGAAAAEKMVIERPWTDPTLRPTKTVATKKSIIKRVTSATKTETKGETGKPPGRDQVKPPVLDDQALIAIGGVLAHHGDETPLGEGGGSGRDKSIKQDGLGPSTKDGNGDGKGKGKGKGKPGDGKPGNPDGPLEIGPMRPGVACVGTGCKGGGEPEFRPPSECDRASPPSWCNGPTLDRDTIDQIVKAHAGAIDACYQRALDRDPGLAGTVKATFAIAPDGHVTSARVAATTLHSPAVDSCVLGILRSLSFPPRGGGTVNYPFVFSRGG